ncbi:MAG: hypothetical protein IJX58_04605, partial [Clostridia bacterium]|nr:hypothetical protein [Clostridia bacterium]
GVYAYFYILLVILSLFATNADSIFAVSVLNLYNIFMVVFAYVGFTVSLDTLKNRMKPVTATLVLIAVLLIFASFAAQILAAFGVLYSIRNEKLASGSSGSN